MPELDVEDLRRRVIEAAGALSPGVELDDLRRLEGGVSSLTFASSLRRPDVQELPFVLKVAPPGLAPVRNRDVLRQARVLRHLADLDGFPVPRVLFEDAGSPPLFAMELVAGDAYEPRLDTAVAPPSPAVAASRMRVAARALARLHSRAPEALGAGAEPVIRPPEELGRWQQLFATVDGDLAAGHEALRARLAQRLPRDIGPSLLHGDYRLANMLFVGDQLTAVIDWEIWSVGDPRTDLAWLIMHRAPAHVFHEDRSSADVAAGGSLPSRAELLDEYVATRALLGADEAALAAVTKDLDWFLGLCFYKVASTTAVIIKRDRKRPQPDPKLVVAARHLDAVLDAGHAALS